MSPSPAIYSIDQTCLDIFHPSLDVQVIHVKFLTETIIATFLTANPPRSIGIAGGFSSSGSCSSLGLVMGNRVLIVVLPGKNGAPSNNRASLDLSKGRQLIEETLNPAEAAPTIFGFDMDKLALALWADHRLPISNAIDVQSLCEIHDNRRELNAIRHILGDDVRVYAEATMAVFDNTVFDQKKPAALAERAWLAYYMSIQPLVEEAAHEAPKFNTKNYSDQEDLAVYATTVQNTNYLASQQPTRTRHEFRAVRVRKPHELEVEMTRFQNRMQTTTSNQHVRIGINGPEGSFVIEGEVKAVQGQRAIVKTVRSVRNLDPATVIYFETVGRGHSTKADTERDQILRTNLRENKPITSPWWNNILKTPEALVWPEEWTSPPLPSIVMDPDRPLNNSQLLAVTDMLTFSNNSRITLIQGPPGTGKTSVIASFVVSAVEAGCKGIWLTAQSNVAVRNIAEKLLSIGFTQWRILVSEQFHCGWHEHLYREIQARVIRSDDFRRGKAQDLLQDSKVLLCTVSMFSNSNLRQRNFTRLVPVEALIVDEASQIRLDSYQPVFEHFSSTLRKMCFIGDDKQLPPYGQAQKEDLKSIFEVDHLRDLVKLLDTQYRMPPAIGKFVSKAVYSSMLSSNPLHPIKGTETTCYFIDVENGKEVPDGTSWINEHEQEAVVEIARQLEEDGKNYRIITPYDAQRGQLERLLKEHELNWGDRCFNVDSFQGNEDDHIIISLVRTKRPGFLNDLRRTNVMLTRCKRRMYICTNYSFIKGAGSDTLVGRMAAKWGKKAWISSKDLETGDCFAPEK